MTSFASLPLFASASRRQGIGQNPDQSNWSDSSVTTAMDNRDQNTQPTQSDEVSQTPLKHEYLTFDTPLPLLVGLSSPRPGQPAPPPCPDLSKYASPFLWSEPRKSVITWISCGVTAMSAYAAGEYTPPADELTAKWNVSRVVYNLGITLFCLGFGIAPMILAPFSEINGRRPIFVSSGLVFTVCLIGCGATDSFAGLLVARFFLGIGGSTFSTMVGGVISDIYHTGDRNTPMSYFSGSVLFGTGLGPLISGFIQRRACWRWIYYSQAIAAAVFLVILFFFLSETRGSVLLSRKAKTLNTYYDALEEAGYYGMIFDANGTSEKQQVQRIRWKVKSDEERESLTKMISISCYRPFPVSIAAIIGTVLSVNQEKLAAQFGKMSSTPEGRLYFACVESILMPVGLFWFGWTSYSSVPWIVPTLAIGCSTIGILSIYLATFNYLADTYHRYASSAIAAQSFCRNVLGGVFPLVTNAMFTNLGYPAACSLLGGIGILLTIVPWVLVCFGPKIRARSKFASVGGSNNC
ncbi:major facilitator superfamily domain-containing protein [Aspergillus falconensis]